ncbi:Ff.00g020510.m01.CDS01 [Fusarium sp. VM40]|nr:Ff.00g020510.m01.CDS01 [Fusarium sp. VM40]
MATIDPAGDNTSQYHHFVPQFLLRNFAHNFEPKDCTESEASGESREKKKKKQKNRHGLDSGKLKRYPGDKVVNNVNLLQTPYVIDESPVKRILGLTDMYRDKNGATKRSNMRWKKCSARWRAKLRESSEKSLRPWKTAMKSYVSQDKKEISSANFSLF